MTLRSSLVSRTGPQLVGEFGDLAIEAERQLIILVFYRRAGIDADVEGLVDRHKERDRVWNLPVSDLPAINLEHASAALAKTGTIAGEVEHDSVPTWCECRVLSSC
jgi:hypothetical protein